MHKNAAVKSCVLSAFCLIVCGELLFFMSAVCKGLDGAIRYGSLGIEVVMRNVSPRTLTLFCYDFPEI